MPKKIGLVINPDAGKDIRRFVSHATFSSNFLKVDLGKRVVVGADAAGVDEVMLMHDSHGLGEDVVEALRGTVNAKLTVVDTPCSGTIEDTITATSRMEARGAGSIVLVGGDGTLRAAFKGAQSVPLACVPAGTNNVMGSTFDATLVGLAAGLVAAGHVDVREATTRAKLLEVLVNGEIKDISLIDVAALRHSFVGARAIINTDELACAVFTKGEPTDIGLTSIVGLLRPVTFDDDIGLFLEFGEGGKPMNAVIAPGLIKTVVVRSIRQIRIGETVRIPRGNYAISFDGERELEVTKNEIIEVKMTRGGPLLIDVRKTLSSVYNRKMGTNASGEQLWLPR
jgi:predicted polyphosphate/ATP-dependent NAD kinase